MPSHNRVTLIGNLTREPELKYTKAGTAYAKFAMAMNRKVKRGEDWKDEVCFVDITVFGKLAENCTENLLKGRMVFIDGRLNFNSWESKDGQKLSKLDVVANTVEFLNVPKSSRDSQ